MKEGQGSDQDTYLHSDNVYPLTSPPIGLSFLLLKRSGTLSPWGLRTFTCLECSFFGEAAQQLLAPSLASSLHSKVILSTKPSTGTLSKMPTPPSDVPYPSFLLYLFLLSTYTHHHAAQSTQFICLLSVSTGRASSQKAEVFDCLIHHHVPRS